MLNKFKQSGLGEKSKTVFNRLVKGSRDYYLCHLPYPTGYLSRWLLKHFYSGIRIDQDQIDQISQIPPNAIVIYVGKFRSNFEYLFYHTRYGSLHLPVPEIWMDHNVLIWQRLSRVLRTILTHTNQAVLNRSILTAFKSGFIKRALTGGHAGIVSLVGKRGFDRWFVHTKTDPFTYLISLQREIDHPIILIPQLQFYDRKPAGRKLPLIDILFGSRHKPGKFRRLVTMIRKPGKVFVEIAGPLNLKEWMSEPAQWQHKDDHLALLLRRKLLRRINRHRQSITGPIIKFHEELREHILTNERLQDFMRNHAEKKALPIYKVRKQASGYVDEIAARYSPAFISAVAPIAGWLIQTMFYEITVNKEIFLHLKAAARRGPLIFVPCHKSHMDYLILPYILYMNNLPAPHIVAGKNMFFPPFGTIARAGGGFSIRRSFRGAAFYAKVFSEYVHKLLEEGFNIKIYIEGTRSRSGKLLIPKLGFLSILLNAYKNNACKEMSFVPIFIGYDRVLEEKSYLHEQEGGDKKPESIWQVIRARKFLKKRWGRVSIRINQPVSLSRLEADHPQPIAEMSSKKLNTFCRELGFRLINAIDRSSIVTPYAVVAAALLNIEQERIPYKRLIDDINTYLNYLNIREVEIADDLTVDPGFAVDQVITDYIHRGYIERMKGSKQTPVADEIFKIVTNKRPNLDFYKNNCITFFIPAAITALTVLRHDAFQFSSTDLHTHYTEIQSMFKNEFAYDLDKTSDFYVRKCLKAFINEAIVIPHPTMPDTYNLTSAGFRKLKGFSGFLKPYLESYLVVLTVLSKGSQINANPKKQLKKTISRGNRMYRRKTITLKESLSQTNFSNAIALFKAKGIRGDKGNDLIDHYEQMITNYLERLT